MLSNTDKIETSPPSSFLQLDNARLITAKSKSNFSSSFLFLSAEKRRAMAHVYAFFRVIDDVVDEIADPLTAKDLLNSWKRELENTYKGKTIVPLLQELKESIDRFSIPKEYFLKLIEGCEMDLTKKKYENFDELYEYCYRVASMVGLVCMKIFEYESPTSTQMAIDLGLALQLTNIIRDVGVDFFSKGRIYLPQSDLQKFGVTTSDFENKNLSQPFINLMNFQYERTLDYYKKGTAEFKNDSKNKLLAAKIMATVYETILHRIKNRGFPIFNLPVVRLGYAEKMWILGKILLGSII